MDKPTQKYKAYGCQYKCGFRHKQKPNEILKHEEQCWHNPKVRSCVTCEHGKLVHEYCEHPELPGSPTEYWSYRVCAVNEEQEFEKILNGKGEPIKPVTNCPHWGSKMDKLSQGLN